MENLWLAWWNNGLSYDDNEIVLIGVFSEEEIAQCTADKYLEDNMIKSYGYNYLSNASVFVEKVLLDVVIER